MTKTTEQSAAGRTMAPESQAELEAFLESWADEVFAEVKAPLTVVYRSAS